MKILMANTFHYLRGGDSTYTFGLTKLLESRGHTVVPFAMHHPNNFNTPYSKYFVSYIDYVEEFNNAGILNGLKVVARSIYSQEAKHKIDWIVREYKPNIVHLQNIHHHLTPSMLYALKEHNIPVVWTLHDFKILCPNSHFMHNGKPCEKCKKYRYYNAVLLRCKKNSLAPSFIACVESYIHRLIRIESLVDKFIAPSRFLKDKLLEYSIEDSRIVHLPNFIAAESCRDEKDGYFAYVGRLSPEKGVDTLIRAVLGLKGARLVVVGDGPLRDNLEELAKDSKDSVISFLGRLEPEKVKSVLSKALFAVTPSQCYENFPYSILEAFALSKPVIASRIGGMPELVKDGINGLLFSPGDENDLQEKLQCLLANPSLADEMGRRAGEEIKVAYSPDNHYHQLIGIYEGLLNAKGLE